MSLIYAGQQVALSSSNCKEDVGCATKLLLLAEQLAKSSALLFHHLGGSQLLTSACMRLLVRPGPHCLRASRCFSCWLALDRLSIGAITTAVCDLQECNFAEFVSAQPDLSSVAYILNDTGG